jgi:hypothetical protein
LSSPLFFSDIRPVDEIEKGFGHGIGLGRGRSGRTDGAHENRADDDDAGVFAEYARTTTGVLYVHRRKEEAKRGLSQRRDERACTGGGD